MKTKIIKNSILVFALVVSACEKRPVKAAENSVTPIEQGFNAPEEELPFNIKKLTPEESIRERNKARHFAAEDLLFWIQQSAKGNQKIKILKHELAGETKTGKTALLVLEIEKLQASLKADNDTIEDRKEGLDNVDDREEYGYDVAPKDENEPDYESALSKYEDTLDDLGKALEDDEELTNESLKSIRELGRLLNLEIDVVMAEFGQQS